MGNLQLHQPHMCRHRHHAAPRNTSYCSGQCTVRSLLPHNGYCCRRQTNKWSCCPLQPAHILFQDFSPVPDTALRNTPACTCNPATALHPRRRQRARRGFCRCRSFYCNGNMIALPAWHWQIFQGGNNHSCLDLSRGTGSGCQVRLQKIYLRHRPRSRETSGTCTATPDFGLGYCGCFLETRCRSATASHLLAWWCWGRSSGAGTCCDLNRKTCTFCQYCPDT